MPNVQPAFPLTQDAFIVGQATKSRYGSDTAVVETAAGIAFGAPVQRGSTESQIKLFDGTAAFQGILRIDRGQSGGGLAQPVDKVAQYRPAAFFTSGHIAVMCDKVVALDAAVNFNTATGRFTDAATSGTVFACPGWTFDTVGGIGVIGVIKK